MPMTAGAMAGARALFPQVTTSDDDVTALSEAAIAFGILSLRAPLLALKVARAAAALRGRTTVETEDLEMAAALVLAPRATRLPEQPQQEAEPPPPEEEQEPNSAPEPEADDKTELTEQELSELVVAAALAALPPDLLRTLAGTAERARSQGAGRAGGETRSLTHGRRAGTRRRRGRSGERLAVIETLRAAAPWQAIRRRDWAGAHQRPARPVEIRGDDLRSFRFVDRMETSTIFVVDASGSSALHRLNEAKGAVELLLSDCYVRRDQVGLIAFRGRTADVLLEPTRSLARAKRCLSALPGGGGTPIAHAIDAACALAVAARKKGRTPTLVFLTDGRANVNRQGLGGREAAERDALDAARRFSLQGFTSLLIDTSPKLQPQAVALADALKAFVHPPSPRQGADRFGCRAYQTGLMTPHKLIFDRDGGQWPLLEASVRVRVGGVHWHVKLLGQGPALLLLHGTGASTHSWAAAAHLLSKHFTVIIPDLPGHAFSETRDQGSLSLPGMARALGLLLAHLGVSPEMAVGHSAGAAILVRMVLDGLIAPRCLISFNGAILPLHGLAGQIFSPLAKLLVLNPFAPSLFTWRARHPGAVAKILKGTGSEIPNESLRLYERLFQCREHVEATLRMMALWDLDILKGDLPKLKTPLMLVAAERDLAIAPHFAADTAKLVQSARVISMPRTGHLSHEEAPAEATRIILDAI